MNLFEMLEIFINGASASSILKILTSNLGEITLDTLFQSLIHGLTSYVQTVLSMLGITA